MLYKKDTADLSLPLALTMQRYSFISHATMSSSHSEEIHHAWLNDKHLKIPNAWLKVSVFAITKTCIYSLFILSCTLTICTCGLSHTEVRRRKRKCKDSKTKWWATKGVELFGKMILTSYRSEAQRSIYRLALLKIEHLIYFKGCSHSLSNQHRPLRSRAYLHSLFWPPASNSELKSLTLFLSCFFLCPLFPPLSLSPPPLHPSHYSPSHPLFCASACKVGIGKIPKHLRNPVAFCLSACIALKKKKICFTLKIL